MTSRGRVPRLCGCASAKRTAMVTPGGRPGSSTAVHEEYSMWVMPISAFVDLGKLQPHQTLKAPNKIVQFNESMPTVFFLSHQCVVCVVPCER